MNIYLGDFNGRESFDEIINWLKHGNPKNYPFVFMARLKDEHADAIYLNGNGIDLLKLLIDATAQILQKYCHNDKTQVPLACAAFCEDLKEKIYDQINRNARKEAPHADD